MAKKYTLFFLLLYISFFVAQNLTVSYELNFKPSVVRKDSARSKLYFLDILNTESVFREAMRRESDSLMYYGNGFGLGYPANINEQLYIKKDLNQLLVFKYLVSPISRDIFYVKINEPLNWKLSEENKTIGNIKCQKAEVDYGGRVWIAWFAKEIPFQEGPYIFNGLPGLIVEIYDDHKDYLFKLIKIKKNKHKNLFVMKGGKEVSWEELAKFQQDYYTDPYSFTKSQSIKVMTDDGNGGLKKVDLRETAVSLRNNLKEYNNVIELNRKIDYK
ncbi:GLPGLI family protein [Chryseobacterium arthrosphaerae]|nr:GLPGLI family protein [Chryseobacterium arthrosphaerae]